MVTKKFKTDKERKKIIDRIQKMMALADGTQYQAEAETAMRMAQNYMKSYGLSMTDVELGDLLSEGINQINMTWKSGQTDHWARMIANAVAIVFDCQCLGTQYKGRKTIKFIGYTSDTEMSQIVFTCLFVSTKVAARKMYPGSCNKSLRRSFRVGVGHRLWERASAEKETDQKESTRYALVVVEKKDHVQNWVDENLNVVSRRPRQSTIDGEAFGRGKSHANNMDLMNRKKMEQSDNNPETKPLQLGHAN